MAHAQTIAMARTLLQKGQTREIARMLEPLCEHGRSDSPEQALFDVLIGRANLMNTGSPDELTNRLLYWFEEPGRFNALPPSVRVELRIWLGWAALKSKEIPVVQARMALRHFSQVDPGLSPANVIWLYTGRALAYVRLHELSLAEAAYVEATYLNANWNDSLVRKELESIAGLFDERISSPALPPACVVAMSQAMRKVVAQAHRIQHSGLHTLITGPNGVGKRTLARCVHASDPFVLYYAGLSAPEWSMNDLFGDDGKSGACADAEGGTLVITGIERLPATTQETLVARMQDPDASFRLIATSDLPASTLLGEHMLITALADQLCAAVISLPALQDRREDIPYLVRHFLGELAPEGIPLVSVTDEAMSAFMDYPWPGNVRQLHNEIEHALIYAGNEPLPVVAAKDLSSSLKEIPSLETAMPHAGRSLETILAATEREAIEAALLAHAGQVSAAAEALEVTRQGLYKKMKRLNIDPAAYHSNPSELSPTEALTA